jgi:AmmeMemoRadiSam system protein B/AmmeMemoRadiSam system protein A
MKAVLLFHSLLVLGLTTCSTLSTSTYPLDDVRQPAVAGQFYPADAAQLKLAIQDFLKSAVRKSVDKPVALIVPHAGYIYAGQVCADAYRQVSDRPYDVVVILGTNHTSAGFKGVAVYPRGAFQTPLGLAAIDETMADVLIAQNKECRADKEPHKQEHSVEVQVPFVQVLWPGAKIVAVVVGAPDLGMCVRFGQTLAKVVKGKKALIVASSDLSHYPDYESARQTDRETLEAIAKLDPAGLQSRIRDLMVKGTSNLATCACGEAPILVAMAAAKELGATRGITVSYANSGDVPVGDRSRVVGYGGMVLTMSEGTQDIKAANHDAVSSSAGELLREDKKALLNLARETLRRYMSTETVPLVRGLSPRLDITRGAFVTLRKKGQLRGCIGRMISDLPLGQTIATVALESALNDSRFAPVTAQELPDLEIEISVLTPMKPIASAAEIKVGRDGVLIRKSGRSAVFLPQVATEYHWDTTQLLDNLCRKAGLPEGSWRQGAQLMVFQADVFSESDFK